MNFIYLFAFITSCAGYTFNKVSIPFTNILSILNSSCSQSKSWNHAPNDCFNRSKSKLEFTVFAKNPSFERKQRQQRRSKRLKQVIPGEMMSMRKQLDNLVKKSQVIQKRLFGYRLSELPGDGGVIPFLETKSDKPACVRNYFSPYEGKDSEYVRSSMNDDKMVTAICAEPSKTTGKFKNVDPLVSNFFYQVVERVFGREAFFQATFKKTVASIRKHHVEMYEGTQNYYGLEVETLFSHLSPEDMDKLRQMEIQIKSGKLDPSLFSSKFDPMLDRDGARGNDACSDTNSPDFDIDDE